MDRMLIAIKDIGERVIEVYKNNADIDINKLMTDILISIHEFDDNFVSELELYLVMNEPESVNTLNTMIGAILNNQPTRFDQEPNTLITLTPILIPVTLIKNNDTEEVDLKNFSWPAMMMDYLSNQTELAQLLNLDDNKNLVWGNTLISMETFNDSIKSQLKKPFDLLQSNADVIQITKIPTSKKVMTGLIWGICIQKNYNNLVDVNLTENLEDPRRQSSWRKKATEMLMRYFSRKNIDLTVYVGPSCSHTDGIMKYTGFSKESYMHYFLTEKRFSLQSKEMTAKVNINPNNSNISVIIYRNNMSVFAYNYGNPVIGYIGNETRPADMDLLKQRLVDIGIEKIIYSEEDIKDKRDMAEYLNKPLISLVQ